LQELTQEQSLIAIIDLQKNIMRKRLSSFIHLLILNSYPIQPFTSYPGNRIIHYFSRPPQSSARLNIKSIKDQRNSRYSNHQLRQQWKVWPDRKLVSIKSTDSSINEFSSSEDEDKNENDGDVNATNTFEASLDLPVAFLGNFSSELDSTEIEMLPFSIESQISNSTVSKSAVSFSSSKQSPLFSSSPTKQVTPKSQVRQQQINN